MTYDASIGNDLLGDRVTRGSMMGNTIVVSPEMFALGEYLCRRSRSKPEVSDGAGKLYASPCSRVLAQLTSEFVTSELQ